MYSKQMQENFNDTKSFFEEDDLQKMHSNVKSDSYTQVSMVILVFVLLLFSYHAALNSLSFCIAGI